MSSIDASAGILDGPAAENIQRSSSNTSATRRRSFWPSLPAPLRAFLDQFPIITYAPNKPPLRAFHPRNVPTLFISNDISNIDGISGDPNCAKYQIYCHLLSIRYDTQPATPASSPTCTLPIIIPPAATTSIPHTAKSYPRPILPTGTTLWTYLTSLSSTPRSSIPLSDPHVAALVSLCDTNLYDAFSLLFLPCPTPLLPFLQDHLPFQPNAATSLASSPRVKEAHAKPADEVLANARAALDAIQEFLVAGGGPNGWFFGAQEGGVADATVWAYLEALMRGKWGVMVCGERPELVKWWERVGREVLGRK